MTENNDLLYAEEFIDLRKFLLTLWKKKWMIALVMVLFGLGAFLVSRFLVSEKYESAAYISITKPSFKTEFETSIQSNLIMVETSGLPGLAESTAIKDLTFNAMGVTEYDEQRSIHFSASMQGDGQLKLMATAEDPALAAETANTWAAVMTIRLNELYGTNQETINKLEQEVLSAKNYWFEAQLALEFFLSESRLDSAGLQLDAARSMLMISLQEIDHNQLLLSDIQTLLWQVDENVLDGSLSIGTALSLVNLQQRASASQGDPPLQIQIEQSMKADLTAAEAKLILLQLQAALENQNQLLENEVVSLEDDIIDLALDLEQEQYRVAQLTDDRDLARQAYTALSSQLEETRITQAQEEYWPLISAQAMASREPVGPNVLLYTVLTSMLGLFICVIYFLFQDWWNLEGG